MSWNDACWPPPALFSPDSWANASASCAGVRLNRFWNAGGNGGSAM